MSKTAKKLLSVVLAVLVLAAGFSTTLGAFKPVSADQATVLDYTTLITEVTTNNKVNDPNGERGIVSKNGQSLSANFYVVAPESFGIHDTLGFGTNYDEATRGLRVEDFFFQFKTPNRIYSVGADREDIHPYITYEVEAGTSFSIEFMMYNVNSWVNFGLSAEMADIDILVSSDGLNFIPAKFETRATGETHSAWEKKIATVANVGADTRYVKVQSRVNPTTVTYHADGTVNYYPQDALIIRKVTLNKPTTEVKSLFEANLEFGNNKVLKNGVEISSVYSLFLGGSASKIDFGGKYGITPTGNTYGMYKGGGWENKHAWGSIAEKDRSLYLAAKPGTRFQLTWGSYGGWTDVAYALMAYNKAYNDGVEGYTDVYAEYDSVEDFAWKVYTSDSMTGEWTEHKMVNHVARTSTFNAMSYDFIIPEGHIYVKVVSPLKGTIGCIMKTGEDGYPMAAAQANAVNAGSCGNDWAQLNSINYTPFTAEGGVTYSYNDVVKFPYGSGGQLANGPIGLKEKAYDEKFGTVDSKLMTIDNYGGKPYGLIMNYTDLNGVRPYVTYKVQPGSTFITNVFVDYNAKGAAEAELGVPFEFIVYTSSSINGPYTEAARTATTSTATQYQMLYFDVPENHMFVKVEYPQSDNVGGAVKNHQGYMRDVSFVPVAENTEGMVTKDYKGALQEAEINSSSGEAAFNATIGAYATKNGAFFQSLSPSSWNATNVGGIGAAKSGTNVNAAKTYILYNVEPGTLFSAETFINSLHRKYYLECGVPEFEFVYYASATADGTYERISSTKTVATSGGIIEAVEVLVPSYANFIKVEFPQVCSLFESDWDKDINGDGDKADKVSYGNHDAWLRKVSFVPNKAVAVTYDYKEISANYLPGSELKYTAENFNEVAGSVAASGVIINGWSASDKLGMWVDNTGFTNSSTNFRDRSYIIYDVQPGTEFKATFSGISDDHFSYHPGETKDSFKVRVYASDAIDGTYEELGSYAGGAITVTVPAGKRFVKVEFPQRNEDVPNKHWGNHCVFYQNVSFVKFYKDVDAEEVDTELNDYVAKGEVVLDDEAKTAYEIYDFAGVIGTANGLAANADDAYVTYKVSNDQALVIKSADKLDIAVSYDGKRFVDAQLYKTNGAYTVNVIEGKQYVKVALDNGEAITAVKATPLAPTATFVNYAGTTQVIELEAYGATPATTINTSRVGYTFSGWDTEVGALYLDKTYTAQYDKNETAADFFTVGLKTGSEGTITVAGDRALNEVRFDDRVTVEAPASYSDDVNTVVFDKWVDANGNTVSNSHKFSFLASGSIVLEAVYAESKSEVSPFIYNSTSAIVADNGSKWNMSVTWSVNVPAGTTIKETGIVLAATETTMEVGAANTFAMKHSSVGTGKTLMYTVNNIADGATRYARPYAVLADGTVIYGVTVSATDAQ